MITEDYVSFENAKLLKEKGFDKDINSRFSPHFAYNSVGRFSGPSWDTEYNAPTLQMAMKWLREVHNCIITCWWEFENYVDGKPDFSNIVWSYNIAIPKYNSARKGNGDYFDMDSERENYLTYEEACEAAIKYCLENLI